MTTAAINAQQLRADLDERFKEKIAATQRKGAQRADLRRQLAEARQHGLKARHQRKEERTMTITPEEIEEQRQWLAGQRAELDRQRAELAEQRAALAQQREQLAEQRRQLDEREARLHRKRR